MTDNITDETANTESYVKKYTVLLNFKDPLRSTITIKGTNMKYDSRTGSLTIYDSNKIIALIPYFIYVTVSHS